MKKTLYILSMLALAACTVDNIAIEEPSDSDVKFYASFEGMPATKTYLDGDGSIRWTEDDCISIFTGNTYNKQFRFDGDAGENVYSFCLVGSLGTGNPLQTNYSVYPYSEDNTMSTDGVLSVVLPETQAYAENSFGQNANTMVAVTENVDDKNLLFKNACGYLKMSLYGEETIIKTLTLRGNNGEKISGAAQINASYAGVPSVSLGEDATSSITIDCGEGVALGATQETATVFYFVVPPVVFTNGITITATATDGRVFEKSTTRPLTVARNTISKMNALEYDIPAPFAGLTFRAGELDSVLKHASNIALNKIDENAADITLEYKTGKNWLPYTIGTTFELEPGDSLCFRAGAAGNETLSGYQFYMDGKFFASGNTMSLLDKSMTRNSVSENCFKGLFSNCDDLYSAPELPATNLAAYCYSYMFDGCFRLDSAPELPATVLADHCYTAMFQGCSALTSAPALPATTLAASCYAFMFNECHSLGAVPALPATILAPNCYEFMFRMCYNFVNTPVLPATTLADYCYSGMFAYCSGINSAPELPARTLASHCYQLMFFDCSRLNYVKMLATDISAEGCFESWLYGVNAYGSIEVDRNLFDLDSAYDQARTTLGIPEDWEITRYMGEPIHQ